MNYGFKFPICLQYWKSCVWNNKFWNRKINILIFFFHFFFFGQASDFRIRYSYYRSNFNCIIEYLNCIVRTKVALWNSVFIWIPPDHNINPHIHQNALPFLTHKNLNVNLIHRYSTFEDTDFLNRLNYERLAVINL